MRNKNYTKRMLELRATAKGLAEQRADAVKEMQDILNASKTENRAITDEENTKLETLEKQIAGIDRTLAAQKRSLDIFNNKPTEGEGDTDDDSEQRAKEDEDEEKKFKVTAADKRAFMGVIKDISEKRAGEQNFNLGNNGAILPVSISHLLITKVEEICPIFRDAERSAVKGTYKIPVYGGKIIDGVEHNITVAYAEEFTELTADAGAFTSIDLTGYLIGALTLVGKSLINNSEIPVFDKIIDQMALAIARFAERENLRGTVGKCTGALSTTNVLTIASSDKITADDLIDIQTNVPTVYQKNAVWTMNPLTFRVIKKLKDAAGQYLLQPNGGITSEFPYTILGKPVYLSDNMPLIGSKTRPILYGDYKGLGINMRESVEMQVLREKYATQHAIGLVAWFEMDSKIIDAQKLAALEMAE